MIMTMIRRGKNCNKYSIFWPPTCIEIQACIQEKKKVGSFLAKNTFMRWDEMRWDYTRECERKNSLDFLRVFLKYIYIKTMAPQKQRLSSGCGLVFQHIIFLNKINYIIGKH